MLKHVFSLLAAALVTAAPLRAEAAGAAGEDATRPEFRAPDPSAPGPTLQRKLDKVGPGGKANPYREHAPLALFSLGSLAVGGVFYGIHQSLDYPGRPVVSGDGTRVGMAIGAAGLSALAAGAAYFWYTLRAERPAASGWTEAVSAGVMPEGGVAASVTLPLSILAD